MSAAQGPEILYANLDIVNASTSEVLPDAIYTETRTASVVPRASDYRLSIIRWQAQGGALDLPLWIPQIAIGQTDPDLTVYKVGLELAVDGPSGQSARFSAVETVRWRPQFVSENSPGAPLTGQLLTNRYYWAQDYWHALQLINDAYAAVQLALESQAAAWWAIREGSPWPGAPRAPVVQYKPDSDKFSISCAADTNGLALSLYMNGMLRQLLNHFPCDILGPDVLLAYRLKPETFPLQTDGLLAFRQMEQVRSSSDAWCPIASVAIATNLPIQAEDSSEPNNVGVGDVGPIVNSASNNSVNVITDVALALQRGDEYLGAISYAPSAQYRWCQLTSSDAINALSFSFFWKCRYDGALRPCKLTPGASVSIKALLQRRF
jgi:hypothetical protein